MISRERGVETARQRGQGDAKKERIARLPVVDCIAVAIMMARSEYMTSWPDPIRL
jgi:hypothetical protein